VTGRATGGFVEAPGNTFMYAPFGDTISIVGVIGLGTDFLGGGAPQFKYRVEVKRDEPSATYEPVIAEFPLFKFQRSGPFIIECAPGETLCQFTQAPLPAASEGGESGWYLYHEDLIGPLTQEITSDVLVQWSTDPSMEGRWKVRLHVKDASNNHYFSDAVTVRIDSTDPDAVLTLVDATFEGNPLPALECGKFPKGTVLSGTFSGHDGPTLGDPEFQHYRLAALSVHPHITGNVVDLTTVPLNLAYPAIPTTGVDGTWTLDTQGMQACGYVMRLEVRDRTITSSGNAVGRLGVDDFGFCLEEPEG